MDVVQEWSVAVLGERVEEFMVFGASKRGECTVVAALMAVLVAVVLTTKMAKLHLRPTLQDGRHGSQLRWTLGSSRVISSFTCAHVTRHTSHVTRHTSHVTRHTSHVTRHTSHVHTSHVTRHTSHTPTFPSSSQHSLSIVSTTHPSIIHKTSNQLTCHRAATPPLYPNNKPSRFTAAAPIVFDALDFMQFLHRMWRRCGLFSV